MSNKLFIESEENLARLRALAELSDTLENYVYLREDDKGRYIEYAFIDGAPENNRCLSWYDKLQPNALKRNNHDISLWKLKEVDKLYELHAFTCSSCKVGEPKLGCSQAIDWSYDEPIKCACWFLRHVRNQISIDVTFDK